MKKNWLMIGAIVVLLVAAIVLVSSQQSGPSATPTQPVATATHSAGDGHSHGPSSPSASKIVPAFLTEAPSRSSLKATLEPDQFEGKTREAYRAAREIPVTLAQMPCYCYCDRGMGHKSLYSCFEDDHAAHCAVCVNEALTALRLEKQEKLTVPQIRERIMAQFGQLN